jgi:glyoxylase-like metal-dependent hydrolase (beta-lactamase superfamily II)
VKGPVEVRPGIHALGSELVNWYLVKEGGRLTAVDAGLPGFRDGLEADLREIGHSLGDIGAVVLTHSDSDHTGLAPLMRDAGAQVLIHSADLETLRDPGPKSGDASPAHILPYLRRTGTWRFFVHLVRVGGFKPEKVEGADTYVEGDVLEVPGRPRVVATPGHTPGHCALHFERHGALFVGDALCTWNFATGGRGPQIMPSPTNVSNDRCLRSLDAIESIDAEVLLPGHGGPWHGAPAAAVRHARQVGRT